MPTTIRLRVARDCPVVGYAVVLSRHRVFMDYVLLGESEPTCSEMHTCLGNHGDIKNIPECLLHNASEHVPAEDSPQ